MNELSPAPKAEFRPKNGAILATGILLGLTGLMMVGAGFLTLFQTFAMQQIAKADPKAMSELAGMQDMMWTASLINLVFYGGLGLLFLAVAYGCITYRRWARPFALTLGWGWVFMGITMLISLSVMMGGIKDMMGRTMEKAAKSSPSEAAMPEMDGIFTVIMVIYFVMILLFLIALPTVILWLQWGDDVRRTYESRDRKLRWTDRQPAPLIGMTIAAALFAACSLPYLFLMQSPLMKAFLPDGPLKYAWLLIPFVWAYVAWGSYRRQIAAWILAVLERNLHSVAHGCADDRGDAADLRFPDLGAAILPACGILRQAPFTQSSRAARSPSRQRRLRGLSGSSPRRGNSARRCRPWHRRRGSRSRRARRRARSR